MTDQATVRRINVVGSTGSGKTALALRISKLLGIPHVELDAFRHGPGWTETPDDLFRKKVSLALSSDAWVVDGNYHVLRDVVWPKAGTIVWLDYRLRLVAWRLFRRTLRRSLTGEELWNGNRERFRSQFFSRDLLFVWLLQTYWRRKREFSVLFKRPEYVHLDVVQLRSPRATERWMDALEAGIQK